MVSSLPVADNDGTHDISLKNNTKAVRPKMHAEALTVDKDAIRTSEDEYSGCQSQQVDCRG